MAILWPFESILWLSLVVIFTLVAFIQHLITAEEDRIRGSFDMLALLSQNGKCLVVVEGAGDLPTTGG